MAARMRIRGSMAKKAAGDDEGPAHGAIGAKINASVASPRATRRP
jgi:hypothetical protein